MPVLCGLQERGRVTPIVGPATLCTVWHPFLRRLPRESNRLKQRFVGLSGLGCSAVTVMASVRPKLDAVVSLLRDWRWHRSLQCTDHLLV